MKHVYALMLAGIVAAGQASAQRITDKLDRGLVAVPSGSGNLVSWRIFGEEYYDTQYNIYRNGKQLNTTPLRISNYLDATGTTSASYQVAAVVNGVEQPLSKAVTPWQKDGNGNPYYQFSVQPVLDREGKDVTDNYTLNDISLGDVNGDGISEFIVKRNSNTCHDPANKTAYTMLECYDIKGNRLWYIDLGPNMLSGADEQYDIVLYDWDGDGKAEALLRGADNMILHTADGKTINIGNMSADTRWNGIEYTSTGNEYLLYLNGETGEPYPIGPASHPGYMDYPLPRGNDSDWGTGIIGHRSTKHYFGAPFLDGRHASIFLGRGCYTKHAMTAFDVDPATHQLTKRWYWTSDGLPGAWFGQGYHNYAIADVDLDGRDEIVFGSMVIDDNGKGLSTTGLGHGDAQHCGDFDPYRWGLEQFACNETSPNMNYRNATTSEYYYRSQGSADDGRALIGNFSNSYPGCLGRSTNTDMISSVADKEVPEVSNLIAWGDLNFRIYWDGDLLDEVLNSPGTEREAKIEKPGQGRIFTSNGCKMNNWSKNNPGAQGDILGDWREEIVLRTGDNKALRIYATPFETKYRNYTLWHDHEYRNAMVWQSMGYNQPPHVSYFLGEMEGITVAPPPLTMTGREEVANGGTIGASANGKHMIVCETNDTHIQVADGATPAIVTFNVPSWTQGANDNNNIQTTYYTSTVEGAAFSGKMRLVKQGEGILSLPAVDQSYTGNTDVWAGTLQFDGKLLSSPLWLNRFAKLKSNGGSFRSIKMDYAAQLLPGTDTALGQITTDTLKLGFGSRIVFDLDPLQGKADQVHAKTLSIETKDWKYGPKYLTPVFEFKALTGAIETGRYLIASADEMKGTLSDIRIEGVPTNLKSELVREEDGSIYLVVSGIRDPHAVIWNGESSANWNLAADENFTSAEQPEVKNDIFVNGDHVTFGDEAKNFDVVLKDEVIADTVLFDHTSKYSLSGTGAITGNTTLVKRGTGTLTISTDNTYTGGTRISGGTLSVSSLSNDAKAYGNLGAVNTAASKFIIENGARLTTTGTVTQGSPMQILTTEGGVINNTGDFVANKAITGTTLRKTGAGWLKLNTSNTSLNRLVIEGGTVLSNVDNNLVPAKTVVLAGGAMSDCDGSGSYSNYTYNVEVPEGKSGTWHLDSRATYNNKLTGAGTLTVNIRTTIQRTQIQGNWSAFEGVIKTATSSNAAFPLDNSYGLPKAELNIADGMTVINTAGKTFAIGKVSGSGALGGAGAYSSSGASGTVTWKIGNDENWSWAGRITGTANLVKAGEGRVSLSGKSNDYTGYTKISGGELHISSGVKLGTGTLTVDKDAIFSGVTASSDNLTNSSYAINGTLQVGIAATSKSGVMNFGGKNVTFSKTGVLRLGVKRCATATNTGGASIDNIGKLTMNGTIDLIIDGNTLAEGDSVILWKAKSFSGTPVLMTTIIDTSKGLYWDTTDLARGVLRVASDPALAIQGTATDAELQIQVVGADGTVLDSFKATAKEAIARVRKSDLPRGTYLVRMSGRNGSSVVKVAK